MVEDSLAQAVSDPDGPMLKDLRECYISHLRNYYYVGGMPECVNAFSKRKDYE